MENVEFAHRPGLEPAYVLSWDEGPYRYHVWTDRSGAHGGSVFRNPVNKRDNREPTVRYNSTDEFYREEIAKAWAQLGLTVPEAVAVAEQQARERAGAREAGIDAGRLQRFRTAFAEALKPYPGLAKRMAEIPDAELLEIGKTLLRIM